MFEEQYANYPAAIVERIRNDVTMGALKGAAVRMGGAARRAEVDHLRERGFTAMLPTQLQRSGRVDARRRQSVSRRCPARRRRPTTSSCSPRPTCSATCSEVFDTLNRQNTSIYAVDPRGLAAFEYDINEGVGIQQDADESAARRLDTLRELAENTDGRAIVNRNDLDVGMKQIIRDSSGYYLLGYNSTQAPTDGKFHEIKVNVKRTGVDVRARKGYWAYTRRGRQREQRGAEARGPVGGHDGADRSPTPARDRAARFWIGTSRGENGKTRLTFVWEPAAAVARAARGGAGGARGVDGDRAGWPSDLPGRVPDDGAGCVRPRSSAATAPVAGAQARAPRRSMSQPGHLELKMVVEGSRGQVIDSVGRELTVPDYARAGLVRNAARLPGAHRSGTAGGQGETGRAADRRSRVQPHRTLLIRLDAYAPAAPCPPVTARLLNRGGQAMADLPVQPPPGRRPRSIFRCRRSPRANTWSSSTQNPSAHRTGTHRVQSRHV